MNPRALAKVIEKQLQGAYSVIEDKDTAVFVEFKERIRIELIGLAKTILDAIDAQSNFDKAAFGISTEELSSIIQRFFDQETGREYGLFSITKLSFFILKSIYLPTVSKTEIKYSNETTFSDFIKQWQLTKEEANECKEMLLLVRTKRLREEFDKIISEHFPQL